MSKVKLPVPSPVQHYARCVDASSRPADYVGEWPEAGRVYPVRVLRSAHTGQPQVHILGFHVEAPYGAFAARRFETVAEVWLN
ncbi:MULTISPECIES: hypothetical protein [Hymenobacter]|uniref:Uncharacterized protein n=1 Tax=Hymenobacter jejuensis TaxID=2502781 RepID=A0A5B7ZYZ3_9BACT|nr:MULTISPECIES: hypothetical protein [Hymenobacter]MBC6988640.1 hypothetical protein [Hymenobacter sp. BT491]QDA59062.1 hypothetical protein FHG12_02600 [Hymenobacter jejuensis]